MRATVIAAAMISLMSPYRCVGILFRALILIFQEFRRFVSSLSSSSYDEASSSSAVKSASSIDLFLPETTIAGMVGVHVRCD